MPGLGIERKRAGRPRRVVAFLLSFLHPGAGHFLLGSFRRGVAWALAAAVIALALLVSMKTTVLTMAIAVTAMLGTYVASAVDAVRLTGKPPWKLVLVGWAALMVVAFALAEIKDYYRAHYAQAFTIPSGAMQPTLLVGDYVLTDKSVYRAREPQRGDIVVFDYPLDERRRFIKRIVAVGGETVQVKDHRVLVNGTPLSEPYARLEPAGPGSSGYCRYAYGCEPTLVPPGSYFVMGDNRDNSQDSRYWGFVKRDKILGRAFTIYWSWDRDRHWPRFSRLGLVL